VSSVATRLLRAAAAIVGPALIPLVRQALQDPATRRQIQDILGQIRGGVDAAGPAARARNRLRRDLDATVGLARARRDGARDLAERAEAEAWLRDAEDIRRAADIVDGLTGPERRSVVDRLEARRVTLLRRMLASTLGRVDPPDASSDDDRPEEPATAP
jgi:hypothetical protein